MGRGWVSPPEGACTLGMTWGARECFQRLASTLRLKRDQPHFACGGDGHQDGEQPCRGGQQCGEGGTPWMGVRGEWCR